MQVKKLIGRWSSVYHHTEVKWKGAVQDIPGIIHTHDDVIKRKHCPRHRPFARGIHRSPVNSPHKGQWRGAFMLSLICAWMNVRVNTRETGDWRRNRAHYDVTVMFCCGYIKADFLISFRVTSTMQVKQPRWTWFNKLHEELIIAQTE